MLVQLHWRFFLRRQPQLLPVHVEGQALQWSMSLLCSFTGAVRLLMVRFFWLCTQVHGQGFPRHQGGEGVAGTPGACSQVFCHPN